MLAKVFSAGLLGLEAHLIEVEVDIGGGLPQFPSWVCGRNRSGKPGPHPGGAEKHRLLLSPKKITVNLAPAGWKKEGSGLELSMAIGLLVAEGFISQETAQQYVLVGELSAGRPNQTRHRRLIHWAVVSKPTSPHPSERKRPRSRGRGSRRSLRRAHAPEVMEFFQGNEPLLPVAWIRNTISKRPARGRFCRRSRTDARQTRLGSRRGRRTQRSADRTAGCWENHVGPTPPRHLAAPPDHRKALETTCVHSVAGTLPPNQSLITTRPFRAPHHTISDAGLIGGGTIPKPGEVSMAHHGVLFLDEVLEFKRSVLDGLRQPLEDGTVTVTRVNASLQYPARFMLVVAMNPCPCGHYGDRTRDCICTPQQIRALSGPAVRPAPGPT